jgi:putative protease
MATRSERIKAGRLEVTVDQGLFLPASKLKSARRAFWDWASSRGDALMAASRCHQWTTEVTLPEAGDGTPERDASVGGGQSRETWIVSPLADRDETTQEVLVPFFCPEGDLSELRSRIQDAYRTGIRRFRLTGLFQIPFFDGLEGVALVASYPLPVSNALAVEQLARIGFSRVQGWVELEKEALQALRESSPLPLEIYRRGRLALLTTRADVQIRGRISDSRGGGFEVAVDGETGLATVLSEQTLDLPSLPGTSSFFDYRSNTDQISRFNWDRGLT